MDVRPGTSYGAVRGSAHHITFLRRIARSAACAPAYFRRGFRSTRCRPRGSASFHAAGSLKTSPKLVAGSQRKMMKKKSTLVELSSDSPSKSEPIPDGPSSRCVKCLGKIRFSSLSSQTLPDCRGPGPLQSHKLSVATDKNLIFPRHFTQRDEGKSASGTQI